MIRGTLGLGNPKFHEVNEEITKTDMELLPEWVAGSHDTLMDYQKTYGVGRAVATPQIGIARRLLYMHTDKPYVSMNPALTSPDEETYTPMDDCISFPGLMVMVGRYQRTDIYYLDEEMRPRQIHLEGDLSKLLQHECDHLDRVLATMRAVDNKSFYMEQVKRD